MRWAGHVGSGFGDDDVGGVPADAGDGADQVAEAGKRFDHHLDSIGELFYRRGVPIILSSDAHAADQVGMGYEKSLPLVRDIGYREVVTFSGRERGTLAL